MTLPYALSLANHGWQEALRADPALALGLNTYDGEVISEPVAQAHGLEHRAARRACSAEAVGLGLAISMPGLVEGLLRPPGRRAGGVRHTVAAYRRDLRRYAAYLAAAGVDDAVRGHARAWSASYAMRLREGVRDAEGTGWPGGRSARPAWPGPWSPSGACTGSPTPRG